MMVPEVFFSLKLEYALSTQAIWLKIIIIIIFFAAAHKLYIYFFFKLIEKIIILFCFSVWNLPTRLTKKLGVNDTGVMLLAVCP